MSALLSELRGISLYQRMDEVSRQRLAAVIGRTISLITTQEAPKKALERVLPIYRAVGRRSAYLSLLNENPAALERLLNLVAQSAWLAKQMAEQPMLLDELLHAGLFDTPATRGDLEDMLERTLRGVTPDDIEGQLEAIRLFQRTAIFRIAIADRIRPLRAVTAREPPTETASPQLA